MINMQHLGAHRQIKVESLTAPNSKESFAQVLVKIAIFVHEEHVHRQEDGSVWFDALTLCDLLLATSVAQVKEVDRVRSNIAAKTN